jgi:hypothetical protein
MDTLRIVNRLERIQNLTSAQKRATAVAFNNSKDVVGCITDYLESEVNKIDKQLEDPEELYSNNKSDTYVAFLLAERACHVKTLRLLTQETEILDCDQQKDI